MRAPLLFFLAAACAHTGWQEASPRLHGSDRAAILAASQVVDTLAVLRSVPRCVSARLVIGDSAFADSVARVLGAPIRPAVVVPRSLSCEGSWRSEIGKDSAAVVLSVRAIFWTADTATVMFSVNTATSLLNGIEVRAWRQEPRWRVGPARLIYM